MDKNQEICDRALKGDVFADIARTFSISRERVRQIVKEKIGKTAKDLDSLRLITVRFWECCNCHKEFINNFHGSSFCSKKCQDSFIDKNMEVDLSQRSKYKSKRRPVKRYVQVSMGYRNKSGHLHYGYAHRLEMEKHLGRKLRRDEVVHHIDGNSQNNDINNLQLMSFSEHSKMTVNQTLNKARKLMQKKMVKKVMVKKADIRK